MKMKTIAGVLLLAATLPLLGAPAFGEPAPQQPEIEVVLDGSSRPRLRLAFPASEGAAGLSGGAREAAREFEDTLRADLEASGVFVLQGPQALGVLSLTGNLQTDAELYRSLGNEHLLQTTVSLEGDRLVVEGRLTQLEGRRFLLGKRYRGNFGVARRMAHTFADEIIRNFTARPGLTLTSIAFVSDRDGGSDRKEIYVMDYDGWNQRPVTAHQTLSLSPEWTPASDHLAYVSYLAGGPGIYMVELKSGTKKPLLTDADLNISPSISPDGRKIAFARSVDRGNSEIFVSDQNGRNLKQLTRSSGIDTNPAWSPDGSQIAFTSSRGGSPQIYVMQPDGSKLRRVTFEGEYNDGAAWEPSGNRIAHATRRGNEFDLAITDLITLESNALKRAVGSHESPSFSPDGRKLAYASTRNGQTQIYVLDLAGGAERQLTRTGTNRAPSWSGFVQ
jgi:TolB protein